MYEVGVAVTDPVPVPALAAVAAGGRDDDGGGGGLTFTLLRVCDVTEPPPPLLGSGEVGEFEFRHESVVRGNPEVATASVLISRV